MIHIRDNVMTKPNLRIWERAYPNRQRIVMFGFIFLTVGLVAFGELIALYQDAESGLIKIPFSINHFYLLPFIPIPAILAILGLVLLAVGICSMLIIPNNKIPVIRHLFIAAPVTILIVMFVFFALIMFFDSMIVLTEYWFGINNKTEVLKFIGWGMGGMVLALNGGVLDRRAGAQEQNNELVRQGNDDVRFQNVITGLGHEKATVRIATFYRFYYLASKRGQKEDFRKDVFEILCSCLRTISNETPTIPNETPTIPNEIPTILDETPTIPNEISNTQKDKHKYRIYRIECQALLDILFKGKFKGTKKKKHDLVPSKTTADLKWAYLADLDFMGADLSNANLSGANLSGSFLLGANLSGAMLVSADLSRTTLSRARLVGAMLWGVNFSDADLFGVDFSDAEFKHADFSGANLCLANFSGTEPLKAQLKNVLSIEKANFYGATIDNKPITKDDLPTDKGEYYAAWNPQPKKEEN